MQKRWIPKWSYCHLIVITLTSYCRHIVILMSSKRDGLLIAILPFHSIHVNQRIWPKKYYPNSNLPSKLWVASVIVFLIGQIRSYLSLMNIRKRSHLSLINIKKRSYLSWRLAFLWRFLLQTVDWVSRLDLTSGE